MVDYFRVHPLNPQPRALRAVVDVVKSGGLIAYPTDSGFALGTRMGNRDGMNRIKQIRQLNDKHNFTVMVSEFAHIGDYVEMDNRVFRAVKVATPGPFTFILKATREVPRVMLQPKKKTIGIRVPDHVTALAILKELNEPLLTSTLILPGQDEPESDGELIRDRLGHLVDAIIDSDDAGRDPTTVIDFSLDEPEVVRLGAGDPEIVIG